MAAKTDINVDQLRRAIDAGHDKVDHSDPAMAPLGTDDEAGGSAPSPRDIKTAYGHEVTDRPARHVNDSRIDGPTRFYFVFIGLVMMLFLTALFFKAN
jgi:hypothetical protein